MHDELLQRLPHGPGFLFVDHVREVTPGEAAVGDVSFAAGHRVFDGHLPDDPMVPGVIVVEALAQLCGVALMPAGDGEPVRGTLAEVTRVRFHRPARPDETIVLRATLRMRMGSAARFDVAADVDGEPVASGELTLGGLAV